jgi:hypothetical protein
LAFDLGARAGVALALFGRERRAEVLDLADLAQLDLFLGAARIHTAGQWAVQVVYVPGDVVTYQGRSYRALQGGQAQVGWEPPNVPALWTVV